MRGRYSIIGLDPDLIWRTVGARAEINRAARAKPDAFAPCPEPPLDALRALIAESRIALPEKLPTMVAGLFGYLGYDMVRLMEALPQPNPDPVGLADAIMLRPTVVIVFDAVQDIDHCRDAGAARTECDGDCRLQPRIRTSLGHRGCARPTAG